MSDEQEASRRASELRSRRVGKNLPTLSIKDKLRLLDLFAHGATPREINMKMHLSPGEIAALKADMGIVNQKDIVLKKDSLEREFQNLQQEAMQSTEPCDAAAPLRTERREKPKEDLPDGVILNSTVPRMDKLNRKRNEDAIMRAVEALDDDDPCKTFEIPPIDEKSFLLKLHLGVTYWAVHYNVPKCIILKEILRLSPDVNLDNLNS